MLALIHNDAVIEQVRQGGWFDLPNGKTASPALDGWSEGEFRLAEILPADEVPEGKLVVSTSVELVDGEPKYVHVLQDDPTSLDEHKRVAKTQIDEAAEAARLKYITPGAGQAMTYAEKATQARHCLAATDPLEADYPLLAAEIGITAASLADVAAVVAAAHSAWIGIGAVIEGTRLQAKAAIDAAEDVSAVHAAADVGWP